MLSSDQRIQKAVAFLPSSHRLPPENNGNGVFASQEEAKRRYQKWAFT